MAVSTENVTLAKPKVAGCLYVAPYGTTVPTDAVTDLTEDYVCLGYLAEDGIDNDDELAFTDVKAFGGDIVLSFPNEHTDTRSYGLIEYLNTDVLATVYGADNVSGALSTGITINSTNDDPDNFVWVEDLILANDTVQRTVVPNGKITSRGTLSFKTDEEAKFEITVTCYPVDGVTHTTYIYGG